MTQPGQTLSNDLKFSGEELDRRREYDRSRPLERDESRLLISSDKVEGTSVYSADGDKIGSIDHLMIGKRSGRVEYAVMSFGGFLGMGESYHPLPWDALDYDTVKDGYVVDIDMNRLNDAPTDEPVASPDYKRISGDNVLYYFGVSVRSSSSYITESP